VSPLIRRGCSCALPSCWQGVAPQVLFSLTERRPPCVKPIFPPGSRRPRAPRLPPPRQHIHRGRPALRLPDRRKPEKTRTFGPAPARLSRKLVRCKPVTCSNSWRPSQTMTGFNSCMAPGSRQIWSKTYPTSRSCRRLLRHHPPRPRLQALLPLPTPRSASLVCSAAWLQVATLTSLLGMLFPFP
jgi:hypothetical protein